MVRTVPVRPPGEHAFESVAPGLEGLTGQSVDQVEVDVLESGCSDFLERRPGSLGAVEPVEEDKFSLIQ